MYEDYRICRLNSGISGCGLYTMPLHSHQAVNIMNRKPVLILLILLTAFGHAWAAEHEVSVGGRNNSFSPPFLNIQVGDTVTWVNTGGTHNVRSINDAAGAFFSGAPSGNAWTYSYTFTEPGAYDYQCDPHQPFMRGSIQVEGDPVNEFAINAGVSGAWYNPQTAGQGLLFDVNPDSSEMFVAWFTFNDAAAGKEIGGMDQRWFTAYGPYDGSTATLDVTLTTGGLFDDPQTVSNSAAGSVGSLSIEFSSCTEATAQYDLSLYGLTGEIDIIRLLPDVFCESQTQSAPTR